MSKSTNYILLSSSILFSLVTWLSASSPFNSNYRAKWQVEALYAMMPPDTTEDDTIPKKYKKSPRPSYQLKDRYGDPLNNRTGSSPLLLKTPSNIKVQYEADSAGNVTVYEKAGDLDYRPSETMTYEQFKKLRDKRVIQNYWRTKAAASEGKTDVTARGLIPKIYVGPALDRLFGGSYVDFQPNGFVTLNFGARFQNVANPSVPLRQQRNGNFDFDQQASINFNGKIGEKLKITANYDTKASFNFENNLKLDYTGFEEDIIQKIEVGNVSLPINSTLISGAQNLFGVKTQLKFGRLMVSAIAANQRSKTDVINLKGGVQTKNFEIREDMYDENRHFFLSQYFRNIYESSLKRLPMITSGVNITRLEVYITNRNNNTETLRNIAAFADLGERSPHSKTTVTTPSTSKGPAASNDANALFRNINLDVNRSFRNIDNTSTTLEGLSLIKAQDFEVLKSSRRLSDREYTFNPQLGYVSLNTQLRNDEILAVAYEYTLNGNTFKVGELTEDYQTRREDEVIVLKLLKSSTLRNNPQLPMWNLMMKNIYSLNANQINRDGFQLRIIYKDDLTGIDNPYLQEGRRLQNIPLVQVFGMDRLNQQLDPQVDGNFDFVEGITINTSTGRVIFPVLEPFGSYLTSPTNPFRFEPEEGTLIGKYVFNTLYRSTQADASQVSEKNKFFIKGSFQSTSSNEIMLPGIDVDENSISLTAGGATLQPGVDYVVEAQLGRIRILNESILNSGQQVQVNYEKADLFNNQIKTLLGTRLDYQINKDINLGATLMRLRERPTLTRIGMGNEPTNNTIFGMDANFKKDSRFLTKMVDKLPLLQTKEVSTIAFSGEYAKLFPGVAPLAQGNSFIDDFEGTETTFDLTSARIASGNLPRWRLGSTPIRLGAFNKINDAVSDSLRYTYHRAKLAWYNVDNVFYRAGGKGKPEHITAEEEKNHYVRGILQDEVFPNRATQQYNGFENILDVAYYPSERGPYNYNTSLNEKGLFTDPKSNWGAITRAISYDIDFDNANIEYIEFWMMDPFLKGPLGVVKDGVENVNNTTGGKLIFNLGDISEDVMKDGRHAFENGLPATDDTSKIERNQWGKVTKQQFLTNAFDNVGGARDRQDVGLDGLSDQEEQTEFSRSYVDKLTGLEPSALERIRADPSADNYRHYLGGDNDERNRMVLERYKEYAGMDGNSPETNGNELTVPASSTIPDNEDLNNDNTISDINEYYQYEMDLRPDQLRVGSNFIVDDYVSKVDNVKWYQFRIPVREYTTKTPGINGFKSIRFMRMVLTDFAQPVVLRMAQFQMVANQWRRYQGDLTAKGLVEIPESYDAQFKVNTVNIEENGPGLTLGANVTTPYVLPPGFVRDKDISTQNNRAINEQSIQMAVTDLRDGDSRAIFKNMSRDFINYKRLRMYVHAETNDESKPLENGEVSSFIRIGTDFTDNYYEVEVPLEITPTLFPKDRGFVNGEDENLRRFVWPDLNEINVAFEDMVATKALRNRSGGSPVIAFSDTVGHFKITVVGNPDLSSVQTIMIGMRNNKSPDEAPKSFKVWIDELRASGFDQEGGYAALGRLNIKLADFATVTASGRITTYGFGGIQQKISERARENTAEWAVTSTIALDKLLPQQLGLKIPMFVSYENTTISPRFNPLDPDTRLDISLENFDDPEERRAYKKLVVDQTVRRSINFTNVQKIKTNPEAKSHLYDIENLSFTYAYNDITRSNTTIESYSLKSYKGSLAYTFANKAKSIEPFKNVSWLNSPYLKLIKDFNFSLAPSNISIRGDLDRQFVRTQLSNGPQGTGGILPTFEKYFTFNRTYDVRWNLTQSLALDYTASVRAVIDEPVGDLDTQEKKDSVTQNLRNFGRMKNFEQKIGATYRLPLDKLPFTDWVSADVTYGVNYSWGASSYDLRDDSLQLFGNIIQNSRERGINGKVDLMKLYNKVKFLKEVNSPTPKRKAPPTPPRVRIPGDTTKAPVVEAPPRELKAVKGLLRVLMSMRSINFTYTMQEGTLLPGFLPTPRFFGMDSSFSAPGLMPFILGSQDQTIRNEFKNAGLMSKSTQQSQQFTQDNTINLKLQTTLEPFKDFRIQVNASMTKSANYSDFYRFDTLANDIISQSANRGGSFNMSYIAIGTAFSRRGSDNRTEALRELEANRSIFLERLMQRHIGGSDTGKYSLNSQDVLIPAFLAAYSGKDPNKTKLSPFPNIPLPNWRVDYAGLSKLEALKSIFSQVTITHSYNSSYSIGNYLSPQDYNNRPEYIDLRRKDYPIPSVVDTLTGEYKPVFIMQQATIVERFAPLIGINVRTLSKITAKIEYNQDRTMTLSVQNHQLNEISNKGITVGMGFTKANMRLPFKVGGETKTLKNDLTFRFDLTIRDTRTIQHELDDISTVTSGNVNYQLKPTVSYVLNQRLNLQMYFERNVNSPLITSSYRRAATAFGVQLRFSLTE